MNYLHKISLVIFATTILLSCNKTKTTVEKSDSQSKKAVEFYTNKETLEGVYETQTEPDNTEECRISVEIIKTENGYSYSLKTKLRNLKGIATFTKNESGEKYIVLEGIKWDEFEGDISNEEENDSISESKELKIPIGIDASYVKDTLTIQNYGNAMNSYTKLSECGRKYIELIKKN
jgi:hypothetical protein